MYQGSTFWDYPQSCAVSVRFCFVERNPGVRLQWVIKSINFFAGIYLSFQGSFSNTWQQTTWQRLLFHKNMGVAFTHCHHIVISVINMFNQLTMYVYCHNLNDLTREYDDNVESYINVTWNQSTLAIMPLFYPRQNDLTSVWRSSSVMY